MNITVKTLGKDGKKKIEIKKDSLVLDLLKKMNLKDHNTLVLRKNNPIPVDEKLSDNDTILIIEVSSGG